MDCMYQAGHQYSTHYARNNHNMLEKSHSFKLPFSSIVSILEVSPTTISIEYLVYHVADMRSIFALVFYGIITCTHTVLWPGCGFSTGSYTHCHQQQWRHYINAIVCNHVSCVLILLIRVMLFVYIPLLLYSYITTSSVPCSNADYNYILLLATRDLTTRTTELDYFQPAY